MQDAATERTSFRRLLAHVERGATGRLTVGADAARVEVYVLNGEIVAAHTEDDDRLLVRRLASVGALDNGQVEALQRTLEVGEPVFGLLLETVDEALIEDVLYERFRDNLIGFVGQEGEPQFTELSAVFVENIQMGLDARALLVDCARAWESGQAVDLSAEIVRGPMSPTTEEEQAILACVAPGRTLRQVLMQAPLEPLWARSVVARMLEADQLEPRDSEEVDDDLLDDLLREPTVDSGGDLPPTEIIEDGITFDPSADQGVIATEIVERPKPKPRKLADVIAKRKQRQEAEQAIPELDLDPEEDSEEDEPTADANVSPPAPIYADRQWDDADFDNLPELLEAHDPFMSVHDLQAPIRDEDEPSEDAEDAQEAESAADEAEPEPESAEENILDDPSDLPRGGAETLDLSAALHDVDLDDTDLEAFADHDHARGSDSEGAFSADLHHLDRVEVTQLAEVTELPEPQLLDAELVEADEALHTRFSAKLLADDEAQRKVDVAQEVLSEVIAAFDDSEGAGRGLATMQILIDGSPPRFAVLFQDVKLDQVQGLPRHVLLRNLHDRPETEHRQLLNQGLVDLIERALSIAMDEISDDEAIDTLLERTAGYRQRIGL